MFPHTYNPFDTRPPAKKGMAEFLDALGDPQAADAFRKAMGNEASSSTTEGEQEQELTPEELARLQAVTDRESGRELVELRKREYLEWAEEFSLGDDDPEQWIADTFMFNPDGTVEVDGNLDLPNKSLTRLPPALIRVNGSLSLVVNRLTSLEGLPSEIHGYLALADNRLTSLEGLPLVLEGALHLDGNRLTSLEGLSQEIHGSLDISHNQIISLEGLSQEIHGSLDISYNQIASLEGLPQEIHGDLGLWGNPLTSLEGLRGKKIDGDLNLKDVPAKSIPEGIELGGKVIVKVAQTVLKQDAIDKGYRVNE